ncbi:MAG: hypothetical protein IKE03_09260, partial [Blautia sp.]|nr:hypothetical protein [Blautia sp.]
MKKKENQKRYKRRKSVGKRIIRMLILTVLIIFALSAYLNFSFLKYVVLGLFTMNGTNVAAGAKVIAEAPDGLTEYVEDIMQTYHDLPEEIRQDPDSDAYRDAFLKFHEYAYYQNVMGQLAEMEKNVVISNVYLQVYDPETEAMVCLLDPTGAASGQEDPIFGEPMPVGYWESVTAEELEQLKASAAEDASDLSVGQDREIRTKESGSKDIGEVIIVAR